MNSNYCDESIGVQREVKTPQKIQDIMIIFEEGVLEVTFFGQDII